MSSTQQAACLENVADDLITIPGWEHEPNPERWLLHHSGDIPVRVRLQAHVNGVEITLHIPTPGGTVDVVWLGIVSHRLGSGYATGLVEAMVNSYLIGYFG